MIYKRFGNKIVVRIDKGEEILAKIEELSRAENIKLASVSALGAVNDFIVGVYNVTEQKYYRNHFVGAFEIVSLTGSISTMNGQFYAHIHMACGDDKGSVVGGHLNEGIVSATCEMFVDVIDGQVDRAKDDVTGLNLFKFDELL